MKTISKKIIVSLLAVILMFTFAACTGSSGEEQGFVVAERTPNPTPMDLRGEITISGYQSDEADDSFIDYITEVTLEYPGLKVVYDYNYTEEEYFATLDARVASGDIGDVYMVRDSQVAKFASAGKIIDLTAYAEDLHDYSNSGYEPVDVKAKLFPAAYDAGTYNNKLYMIPTEYNHKFVYINFDLLRAAGIDEVPGDKWTWDEFKKYASALTANGSKIVMDYTDYAVWVHLPMASVGSMFETVADDQGNETKAFKASNIANGGSIKGLNELVSFVRANKVIKTLGNTDLSTVGMAVVDRSEMNRWKDSKTSDYVDWSKFEADWDFIHFPRFETHSVGAHSIGFVVKNKAEMTDEMRMLCGKVALYTLFDEAGTLYIGDGSVVPANIEISNKKFWREYPVKGKNTSVFTSYYTSDFCANFTPYTSIDNANKLNSVGNAVEQAVNGGNVSALVSSIVASVK